jgi:hypothetical protein
MLTKHCSRREGPWHVREGSVGGAAYAVALAEFCVGLTNWSEWMTKTVKIFLVLSIVLSAIQIGALFVNLYEPTQLDKEYADNIRTQAALCWKIYFFGGLPLALIGFSIKRKNEISGYALIFSGIYLMLLGNNGGLLSKGYEIPRLVTSVITFLSLVGLSWGKKWNT